MFKTALALMVLTSITASASSQTPSPVEYAIKDPSRADKKAKADVYIQSKHNISEQIPQPAKTTKRNYRKKL